jgi:hypothetical protein
VPSSHLEVDPKLRVPLIESNYLDQRPGRIAALDVHGSMRLGEPQDKATGAILVGIILDDLSDGDRLPDLLDANATQEGLVGGMLGELIS